MIRYKIYKYSYSSSIPIEVGTADCYGEAMHIFMGCITAPYSEPDTYKVCMVTAAGQTKAMISATKEEKLSTNNVVNKLENKVFW